MVEDLGDPKVVRARAKRAKKESEAHDSVLRGVMGSAAGRGWIWSVLERCHAWSTPFDDNPTRMAFLVGEQNVGFQLLGDLQRVAPTEFVTMLREGPNGRVIEDGRNSDSPELEPEPE